MSRWVRVAAVAAVVLASCTAGTTPSPTPSATPAPTPSPTSAPTPAPMSTTAALSISDAAVSYIEAVAGYDLAALPPSLEEQMASEMAAAMGGDGLTDQAIRGYAARAVTLNGTSVGLILVLEFESGWTSLPGTAEGFAQGVAGTGTPIPTTVAGRPAWFITTEATPAILTYLDADFAVTVFGSDEPTVAELGEALIVANG